MADNINGKGALFKNTRKTKDNHPDYTGNVTMTKALLRSFVEAMGSADELKVDLASWIKQGKNGTFLSVSVSAPFKKSNDVGASRGADPDSDAPF